MNIDRVDFNFVFSFHRKELKRLNVTVIDTANETKKVKKEKEACHKKFCKLGCVCESIDTPKFLQTHCRLTKCMFGCVCTNVSYFNFIANTLNFTLHIVNASRKQINIEIFFVSTFAVL